MFITIYAVLFVCSISVLSEAAFVDTIKKCSSKDEECLRTTFSDTFKAIGGSGVPELGIVPFDPLKIKDDSISVLNLFDLKMRDATITGVKNCNIDRFAILLDQGKGINEFTCDLLTIEGKYQFDASIPMFKDDLGDESIRGDGFGNVKIEKFNLKLEFPVKVQKRDGEIYLKYDYNHATYEYEVLGKATLNADNVIVGGKDSTKEAVKFGNDNWKLMLNTFGKPVVEKALKIAFDIISKFYNFVPAKYYLSDDLSSYS